MDLNVKRFDDVIQSCDDQLDHYLVVYLFELFH